MSPQDIAKAAFRYHLALETAIQARADIRTKQADIATLAARAERADTEAAELFEQLRQARATAA